MLIIIDQALCEPFGKGGPPHSLPRPIRWRLDVGAKVLFNLPKGLLPYFGKLLLCQPCRPRGADEAKSGVDNGGKPAGIPYLLVLPVPSPSPLAARPAARLAHNFALFFFPPQLFCLLPVSPHDPTAFLARLRDPCVCLSACAVVVWHRFTSPLTLGWPL